MKYLLALLLLTSCATPKAPKPHPIHGFKTKQERIMDCYKLLKRWGEDGKQAGEFCKAIFKERI